MPHNRGTRHKPRYVGVVSYRGLTKWVGTYPSIASYKEAAYTRPPHNPSAPEAKLTAVT